MTPGTSRSGPDETRHGTDLSLDYTRDFMTSLAAIASAAYLRFPFGGLEVGGVLFGRYEPGSVRILAHRAVPCRYSNGPGFLLSPDDEGSLRALLSNYSLDPELAGMVPVGWYRSHTRSALRLSPEDVVIHDRYFPESWHLALMIKPETAKPVRIGFFLRGSSSTIDPARAWYEIKIEVGAGHAPPPPGPASSARDAVAPKPAKEPRPEPELPGFLRDAGMQESGRGLRRFWTWFFVLLLLTAAAAAAAWYFWFAPPDTGPALDARLVDRNGSLRLEWTPPPGTVSAAVQTQQGDAPPAPAAVDPARAREGVFEFPRHARDVRAWLSVTVAGGRNLKSYCRFVQPAVEADPDQALARAAEDNRLRAEEAGEARAEFRDALKRKEAAARRFQELRAQVDKAQANPD